jgi:hypothetical protein
MFSRYRHFAARLGIVLLLFAQFAATGYACALQTDVQASAMAQHDHMAMDGNCEQSGPVNPALCPQHRLVGAQFSISDLQFVPPPACVSALSVAKPVDVPVVNVIVLPLLLKRSTAPPASVRFQVFRI